MRTMRKLTTAVAAGVFLLPSLLFAESFRALVTDVPDGDTLKVLRTDVGTSWIVRLYGIDCPKIGQAYGREAKEFTESLAVGRTVLVEVVETDRKGRIVATVTLSDGTRIGHRLLKNGWAWWYRKKSPDNEFYQALEHQARVLRIGLWRDSNPLPPWEWRRHRNQNGLSPLQ
jgi:micrococcal nuclease